MSEVIDMSNIDTCREQGMMNTNFIYAVFLLKCVAVFINDVITEKS